MSQKKEVTVQLMVANNPRPESLELNNLGYFGSDTGGWLPNMGHWVSTENGARLLKDDANRTAVGYLEGFRFELVKKDESGRFFLETAGIAGTWLVLRTKVMDLPVAPPTFGDNNDDGEDESARRSLTL